MSGQLVDMSDSLGNDTKYTYDGMGRVMTETIRPPSGGLTTTIMYDPDGDVASVTEPDGTKTTYTYDGSNQLIEATETPMGGGATETTTYSYDMGELVSVTDPDGMITKFAYNAYGDVISMTDPGGGVTTFFYFVVPEPPTWAAMLLGFAGLVFVGRRRAKQGALLSA
jgi:YD repeat-containing protein